MGELTYMLNSKKITEYLTPGHHVHLVGIGGVSMRPLGLVLKGMGMEVTGSDMNASVSTDELIGQGIPVAIGHRAENIKIHADHIIRTRAKMNRLLSEYTGQPLEKIQLDTERDNYMSALQAKEYGLIDEVIAHR